MAGAINDERIFMPIAKQEIEKKIAQEMGLENDDEFAAERAELAREFGRARKAAQISLRGLAERTGIGVTTIFRFESGNPGVGLENLQILLAAVGLRLKAVRRRRSSTVGTA